MEDQIGDVASDLEWTVAGGDYDEALNEALLVYGTSDISTISGSDNIRKIRAVARREVWRVVMQRTAHKTRVSVGAPASTISAENIHAQARKQFEMAEEYLVETYPDISASEIDWGYRGTDESGDDVAPIFQREAFGASFTDWD